MTEYLPEGYLIDTPKNKFALSSAENLEAAMKNQTILEAKVILCTAKHDLIVNLGCMRGIIPRAEGAVGIETGETRDIAIISRVNKPVCFKITGFEEDRNKRKIAVCSRKTVQEECLCRYLEKLVPGDIIPAVVTHMENFGCFADIGCGISSLLPIDSISVSRISHPADRFKNGQNIYAVVSGREAYAEVYSVSWKSAAWGSVWTAGVRYGNSQLRQKSGGTKSRLRPLFLAVDDAAHFTAALSASISLSASAPCT